MLLVFLEADLVSLDEHAESILEISATTPQEIGARNQAYQNIMLARANIEEAILYVKLVTEKKNV